jgi:predicted secreted protein
MATAGKTASLWVGDPLAKVAEVKDVSLSVNGKTIDITNFDSGEWEEFINSTKGWSLSVNANFKATDPSQVAIMNNILNASQGVYAIEYRLTSAAAPKFAGNVVTESYSVSAPVGDVINLQATLKGSGELTFTAA